MTRQIIVALLLVLLFSHPAFAGSRKAKSQNLPQFTISILPPLMTRVGPLRYVVPVDMNNRGEVVGGAFTPPNGPGFGAFLYKPGQGMIDIDPDGRYQSKASRINDAGDVFGESHTSKRMQYFLYRNGEFTSLVGGLKFPFRLSIRGVNNSGAVISDYAELTENGNPRNWQPYLFTPGEGWLNLKTLFPLFQNRRFVSPTLINDRGTIAITLTRIDRSQEFYLAPRNGQLESLGEFSPQAINDKGWITGLISTVDGERAYIYKPGSGLKRIHPKGALGSGGMTISPSGKVTGFINDPERPGHSIIGFFTYKEGEGSRVILTEQDFQNFIGAQTFLGIGIHDMNDRGEMVGYVLTEARETKFFYFSPSRGLFDFEQIWKASTEPWAKGPPPAVINDRGQILAGAGSSAAILTPVQE